MEERKGKERRSKCNLECEWVNSRLANKDFLLITYVRTFCTYNLKMSNMKHHLRFKAKYLMFNNTLNLLHLL